MNLATYHDSGAILRVEVLADKTIIRDGGQYRVVRVRCIAVLRHSRVVESPAPGTEFEATGRIGFEANWGWHLEDEKDGGPE